MTTTRPVTRRNPGGSGPSALETVSESAEEESVRMERPRIGAFDPKGEITFEQYYERWEMYFEIQNWLTFLGYLCTLTIFLFSQVPRNS